MKNLENYGVQELNANEIINTDGGFVFPYTWEAVSFAAGVVGDAIVDAGQWVLGVFAGMGDGISDGLND